MKKHKKITMIVASIICVGITIAVIVGTVIIPNSKYDDAIALMDAGKYDEAILYFKELDGYKDSETQLENCYIGKYGEERWQRIKSLNVGDSYFIGKTEQDTSIDGLENIEWIVLDKKESKVLLLSKYVLSPMQYDGNTSYYLGWENCDLNNALNDYFYYSAFSDEEREKICLSDSLDEKIFLLNSQEAAMYFNSDSERQCEATAYAELAGAYIYNGYCSWWLRSGTEEGYFYHIESSGELSRTDYPCFEYGVRPAMWIEID